MLNKNENPQIEKLTSNNVNHPLIVFASTQKPCIAHDTRIKEYLHPKHNFQFPTLHKESDAVLAFYPMNQAILFCVTHIKYVASFTSISPKGV